MEATKRKIGGVPLNVACILVVELCERFCYYTIQGSQKFFMQQYFAYSNAQSTSITTVFNTACYITCLLGGALADRLWGRYRTIIILATLYVLGTFMVAWASNPSVLNRALFFLGSFGGIAIGTGGIKPNVSNFGADQIEGEDAEETQARFFSYFYWMINIGAGLGLGIMTTMASSPTSFGLPKGYGYFWSYAIAAASMAVCVAIFLSGSVSYINMSKRSATKIFRPIASVLMYSAKQSVRGAACLVGWLLLVPFFILSFIQAFVPSGSAEATYLSIIAFGVAGTLMICLMWAHTDNSFLVQRPHTDRGSEGVEDSLTIEEIRMTFQTMPLLLIANTVFNFAYTMMIGPFLAQSCQMDLRVSTMQISGAFFNIGDCFAIILFIPISERFVYPFMERVQARPVTNEQKLLGGFAWAAIAMIVAVVLEYARRSSEVLSPLATWSIDLPRSERFPGMNFTAGGGATGWDHYSTLMGQCVVDGIDYCSSCAPKVAYPFCEGADCPEAQQHAGIYMSNISGFLMFLPFSLIGLGEIMVNPVLYYYAYSMTPDKTRSVIQAMNLIFQGAFPPALVGVFSTLLSSMQPNNLNQGHLEVFYYISLGIIALGTPAFFLVQKSSKIVVPEQQLARGREVSASVISGALHGGSVAGGSFRPRAASGSMTTGSLRRQGSLLRSAV